MAKKYFPDGDPIGQHLAVDEEDYLVEVVSVFKDASSVGTAGVVATDFNPLFQCR